jgi:transketolase
MRTAFVQTLIQLMRERDNIIVITADMGYSIFEELQQEFPDRFLNTGVTEQSSIGVATGFAASGYQVFFYAQAPFATMRCFEQVRLDVAYGKMDIKIVGSACGFVSNQLGISHFALEDIALMRSVPIKIFCPGDPWEAEILTRAAADDVGPVYIRLGKRGDPIIHKKQFIPGQGVEIVHGDAFTLLATGTMLATASQVVARLGGGSLISLPTIRPLDEDLILSVARKTPALFTIEEHNVTGGLGSAVSELLLEQAVYPKLFYRLGVRDAIVHVSGSLEYLRSIHGLSVDAIIGKITELVPKK